MKETAIEYFEFELKDKLGQIVINQNWKLLEDIIKKAKEMEKQQIENAFLDGLVDLQTNPKEYYNETF